MWSVEVAVSIHKLNVIRRDMFEGLAGLVLLCLRQRQTLHHFLVPPLSLWFPVESVTQLENHLPSCMKSVSKNTSITTKHLKTLFFFKIQAFFLTLPFSVGYWHVQKTNSKNKRWNSFSTRIKKYCIGRSSNSQVTMFSMTQARCRHSSQMCCVPWACSLLSYTGLHKTWMVRFEVNR